MTRKLIWMVPAVLGMGVLFLSLSPIFAMDDEKEISLDQVPDQVKAIMLKEAGDHKIQEVEVCKKDHVMIYEAEWMEGDKEVEIEVVYLCKMISKTIEMADDDQEDEDDDDVEYLEKEVSFNQLPEAVLKVIWKAAGKNKITELEMVIGNNGKYYEAEWEDGLWEVELLLTPEGKVIRKEMELRHDDDDDDDDDDDQDHDED